MQVSDKPNFRVLRVAVPDRDNITRAEHLVAGFFKKLPLHCLNEALPNLDPTSREDPQARIAKTRAVVSVLKEDFVQ